MTDYLIHLADGSGMETNDRYFRFIAESPESAIKATIRADGYEDIHEISIEKSDDDLYFIDGDGYVAKVINLSAMPAEIA